MIWFIAQCSSILGSWEMGQRNKFEIPDLVPEFESIVAEPEVAPIRLMHEFSRERQPLHCDVIVGKQIIFN